MQFNGKNLAGLPAEKGDKFDTSKLLDKLFAPKKTISALVVDRFASEKGCYCAQNGPSNHATQ